MNDVREAVAKMPTEKAIKILESGTDMPVYPHTAKMLDDACKLAVAALRAQQERENLKPLTMDELREMDGEPVWIVDGSGNEMWGLVVDGYDYPDVVDHECGRWEGSYYNMRTGKGGALNPIGWIAYRNKRKVEGGMDGT